MRKILFQGIAMALVNLSHSLLKENRFSQSTTLGLVLLGTLLLSLASQLSLPLQPVPLTFQSTTVLLLAALLGLRLGLASVLSYLGLGSLGLPVFANFSGGAAILLHSSAGYLWGFIPAVLTTGYLLEKSAKNSSIRILLAVIAGTVVLFACGLAWLSQSLGLYLAFHFGLAPFLLSESIKMICLTLFIRFAIKRTA